MGQFSVEKPGLPGSVLSGNQHPGDHQHEIFVGLNVEERAQGGDRSAGHRYRHWLHAGSAAKTNGRVVDDAPAGGVDLHRAPFFFAEVEIEPAVEPADADVDLPFRRIEMRLGLDYVQRRLQGFRTRRASRLLEEAPGEPAAESLSADRPGFAMAVDVEVCETGAIRRMEQLGGLREVDQYVGLRRAAPAYVATFLGNRLVEGGDPAACFLQLRAQQLESGAVLLSQARESLKDFRGECGTRVGGALFGQTIQWIGNVLGCTNCAGDRVRARIGVDLLDDGRRAILDFGFLAHCARSSVRGARPTSMSLKSSPCGGRAMRTPGPSRLQPRAQSRAAASPASSPSARTITSCTSFGSSRERRPDVESAAQTGCPVACIAARQVSIPSPTISTSPGSARRTAPPRHGPNIIFCGSTGAFPPPSRARYVRSEE